MAHFELFLTIDPFYAESVKFFLIEKEFEKIFECPQGLLTTYYHKALDMKIQIVTIKYYKSIYDVIEDFTIKASCFGMDAIFAYLNRQGIKDARKKVIHINNVVYPNANLRYIVKYIGKGYYFPLNSIDEFNTRVYNMGVMDGRFSTNL